MRIITYLIVFILIVMGFTFACLNAQPVAMNYYIGQKDIPLSLLLAFTLFTGGILGWLSGLAMALRLKRDNYVLQQRLKLAEKELDNLRNIPLEDRH
jgi:putative membrane protein